MGWSLFSFRSHFVSSSVSVLSSSLYHLVSSPVSTSNVSLLFLSHFIFFAFRPFGFISFMSLSSVCCFFRLFSSRLTYPVSVAFCLISFYPFCFSFILSRFTSSLSLFGLFCFYFVLSHLILSHLLCLSRLFRYNFFPHVISFFLMSLSTSFCWLFLSSAFLSFLSSNSLSSICHLVFSHLVSPVSVALSHLTCPFFCLFHLVSSPLFCFLDNFSLILSSISP